MEALVRLEDLHNEAYHRLIIKQLASEYVWSLHTKQAEIYDPVSCEHSTMNEFLIRVDYFDPKRNKPAGMLIFADIYPVSNSYNVKIKLERHCASNSRYCTKSSGRVPADSFEVQESLAHTKFYNHSFLGEDRS